MKVKDRLLLVLVCFFLIYMTLTYSIMFDFITVPRIWLLNMFLFFFVRRMIQFYYLNYGCMVFLFLFYFDRQLTLRTYLRYRKDPLNTIYKVNYKHQISQTRTRVIFILKDLGFKEPEMEAFLKHKNAFLRETSSVELEVFFAKRQEPRQEEAIRFFRSFHSQKRIYWWLWYSILYCIEKSFLYRFLVKTYKNYHIDS